MPQACENFVVVTSSNFIKVSKMISDRLHLIFYNLLYYGCKFGAFPITCNKETFTVSHSKDKNLKAKLFVAKIVCILWLFLNIFFAIREFFNGDINQLIVKLLLTIGATLLLTVFSIPNINSCGVTLLINGTVKYLNYVERKLLKIVKIFNHFFLEIFSQI